MKFCLRFIRRELGSRRITVDTICRRSCRLCGSGGVPWGELNNKRQDSITIIHKYTSDVFRQMYPKIPYRSCFVPSYGVVGSRFPLLFVLLNERRERERDHDYQPEKRLLRFYLHDICTAVALDFFNCRTENSDSYSQCSGANF